MGEKREEEEEEEEDGEIKPRSKVWNFGFLYGTLDFCMETEFMYGFYEIMYEFPCLVGL